MAVSCWKDLRFAGYKAKRGADNQTPRAVPRITTPHHTPQDEAGATGASGGETAAAGGSPGQDRRAALDARFKASAEERQASKQARLAAAEDATDPAESAARFWAQFNSKADGAAAASCRVGRDGSCLHA